MGKKCAVIDCRSGYDPTRKDKELLGTDGDSCDKKHIYSFPKAAELRAEWLTAISRQHGLNLDHSGVCELHFKPEDFEADVIESTGAKRLRRRLKSGAVPFLFASNPEDDLKLKPNKRSTRLAKPSARRLRDEQLLREQEEAFLQQDKVVDLDDLCSKLSKETLPSGFRLVAVFI